MIDEAIAAQNAPSTSRIKRLNEALKVFDLLPAFALVNIDVVCALSGRSPASVWRDAATGKLPAPVRVGSHSTRWRAGDIRRALAAASSSQMQSSSRTNQEVAR